MGMTMAAAIERGLRAMKGAPYQVLDSLYLPMDRRHLRRARNIRLIPTSSQRRGGKYSYAEWAHVIGIFQTLMHLHLHSETDNSILDVGCGTGLLGIASEPFLGQRGRYVGLDVDRGAVEWCRSHYRSNQYSFVHVDAANAAYAPDQDGEQRAWDLESNSFDLLTALSVWTHLGEADARHYLSEVERVLKPYGKAIVTFFLLDEAYEQSLPLRVDERGRFHSTNQLRWIFDRPAHGSEHWFSPVWAAIAEEAIGVTARGLDAAASAAGLNRVAQYPGNWKEIPGLFFQDTVVFQKPRDGSRGR